MDEYIGVIKMFAGDYEPQYYLFCQGQLLDINQYQPLFSLIGDTYGGDGVNTFALPDLRSRVPVGTGTGPNLSPYTLAQTGGVEQQTLSQAQLPQHNHPLTVTVSQVVNSEEANTDSPEAAFLAPAGSQIYNSTGGNVNAGALNVTATIEPAGGSAPVDIRQPYLAMNWIICVMGYYPPRND